MQDETVNRTGTLGKFDTCSRSQPGDTGFSFALSCVLWGFPRPSISRKPPGPPPPPQAQLPLAEGTSVTSALNQHQTAAPAPRGDLGAPKRPSPPAGLAAPPEVVPGRRLRVRSRVPLGRREDLRLYGARRPALLSPLWQRGWGNRGLESGVPGGAPAVLFQPLTWGSLGPSIVSSGGCRRVEATWPQGTFPCGRSSGGGHRAAYWLVRRAADGSRLTRPPGWAGFRVQGLQSVKESRGLRYNCRRRTVADSTEALDHPT